MERGCQYYTERARRDGGCDLNVSGPDSKHGTVLARAATLQQRRAAESLVDEPV